MSRKWDWGKKKARNRHVIKLRLKGMTYAKIGEQMGIHETTVMEIVHRWGHDGKPKP